jgi:hypothetical protein
MDRPGQMKLELFPPGYGTNPADTPGQSAAARDEGVGRLVDAKEFAVARLQTAIIAKIARDGEVAADDIEAIYPELVERTPNAMGAAFSGLARKGVIVICGFSLSRRKLRHAGIQRRWTRGPSFPSCREAPERSRARGEGSWKSE